VGLVRIPDKNVMSIGFSVELMPGPQAAPQRSHKLVINATAKSASYMTSCDHW
jgi:hypothetical protein